ncbi:hypothetical protein [Desertibacillus haloalkaliphilus]|uniref:hypothetical protein n=1 Tax=Desertibacillus haloalkaliphilus TaxID=1328930 RepID=UPI001C256B87|nr:hypothetical protein [Desertibacillus haloalkaliphilus]MBU8908048.1 hypothetical protein [Desertibacillus haloalkaliphilus]
MFDTLVLLFVIVFFTLFFFFMMAGNKVSKVIEIKLAEEARREEFKDYDPDQEKSG